MQENHLSITDPALLAQLDETLRVNAVDKRQRLATYMRRYLSPLVALQLFYDGRLDLLLNSSEIERASVVIADVRGYTPQTLEIEQHGRGLDIIADALKDFLGDAAENAFRHYGLVGEFAADRLMALFGLPEHHRYDPDRALLTAIRMHFNAEMISNSAQLLNNHFLRFDIGVGISTGGPVWIGDLDTKWRPELTIIGTVINVASRVEELTKDDEFRRIAGYNIVITDETRQSLSPQLAEHLGFHTFAPRTLRGLGDTQFILHKLTRIDVDINALPIRSQEVSAGMRSAVKSISQRVESYHERREQATLANTMLRVAQEIGASLDEDRILEAVMETTQRVLFATTASLLYVDDEHNKLTFKAVRPVAYLPLLKAIESELELGRGIVGYVAQQGRPLRLANAQKDERFFPKADVSTGFATRSVLCVPLVLNGRVIAVIQVIDERENKFGIDDLHLLETIAAFATTAISNARRYEVNADAEVLVLMSGLTAKLAHRLKDGVDYIRRVAADISASFAADPSDATHQKVLKKLRRITEVTEQILEDTETISTPFQDICLEDIAVNELLDEVIESLDAAGAKEEDVEVIKEYSENLPTIHSDRRRLREVFINVVHNSLHAMRPQRHAKKLFLETRPTGMGSVLISIKDTGPGIPVEHRRLLFRRTPPISSRTPEATERSWGFGLWASHLSLLSLGGEIRLAEEYQEGTCIVIRLPRAAAIPEILH